MKRQIKLFFKVSVIITFTVLVLLVNLFLWIAKEPKSFDFVKPYVEKELNYLSKNFDLKIGKGHIRWDKKVKKLLIDVESIKLSGKANNNVILLKTISLNFNLLKFLKNHLDITHHIITGKYDASSSNLFIKNAEFYLDNYVDNQKLGSKNFNKAISSYIYNVLGLSLSNFISYSFYIEDTVFYIKNNGHTESIDVEDIRLVSSEKNNKKAVECNFRVRFNPIEETKISLLITRASHKNFNINISFDNLISYYLSHLFPNLIPIKNLNIVTDGEIKFLVNKDFLMPQIDLYIKKANGIIELPKFFNEPLEISNISFNASLYDNKVLTISRMLGEVNSSPIDFNAKFLDYSLLLKKNREAEIEKLQKIGKTEEEGYKDIYPSVFFQLFFKNFRENDIKKYIPSNVKIPLIERITESFNSGYISSGKVSVNLSKEDIFNIKKTLMNKGTEKVSLDIPKNSLDIKLNFINTDIKYSEKYPKISGASGYIKINPYTLEGKLHEGKLADSVIYNGNVEISNFWKKTVNLKVFTKLSNAKVKDLASIIRVPLEKNLKSEQIQNIFNSKGKVDGFFKIELPVNKKITYKDLKIHSNLFSKDCVIKKVINNQNIECIDIQLSFKDSTIFLNGSGKILNKPFQVSLQEILYLDKNSNNKKYRIKGYFSAKDLKKLGLVKIPYTEGLFYLDVIIEEKDKNLFFLGKLSLHKTSISVKDFGFYKKKNIPSEFIFKASKEKNKPLEVEYFDIKSKSFNIEGSASFNESLKFKEIKLNKVKYSKNNFKAYYYKDDSSFIFKAKGKKLDYGNVFLSNDAEKDFSVDNLEIDFDIKEILMKNNEIFKDAKLYIDCKDSICPKIKGKITLGNRIEFNKESKKNKRSKGFLSIKSKVIDKKRVILGLKSNNISAFLKGIDLHKNINGGDMDLKAVYTKVDKNLISKGRLEIKNINILKTPLVAKLLVIPSFRGVLQLFKKKGIILNNVIVPFSLSNKIISVENARTLDSTIGITSEGVINLKKRTIDLKGTVIPAYTLNKLFASIPILGKLITGAKNQGFIAANYRMKGGYKDVKVSVNPLSVLSFGFLKDITDSYKIKEDYDFTKEEMNALKGIEKKD